MEEDFLYAQPNETPSISRAYSRKVADFHVWQRTAAFLVHAARQIEPELGRFWTASLTSRPNRTFKDVLDDEKGMQLHDTYLMLLGLALENLLKAVIVRKITRRIFDETEATHRLPRSLLTHNLSKLCQSAEVVLDVNQHKVITKLSGVVIWAGRYPVPLESEPDGRQSWPPKIQTTHSRMYSSEDIRAIEEIVDLVSAQTGVKNPYSVGYE